MIDLLQGQLVLKTANYVVIQTGGLGFRVYVPAQVLSALPSLKEEVTVFTYLHIREDEFTLYGFLTQEDKEMFTTLLSVSGVGPKLALALLSKFRAAELKRIILLNDSTQLVNVPGVGKKTAERIILELKDKVGKQELEEVLESGHFAFTDVRGQAVSALLALGYSLAEAQKAVPQTPSEHGTNSVEELIRIALKSMGK